MREPLNQHISSQKLEEIIFTTAMHVADKVSNCESGSAGCGRKTAEAVLAAMHTLLDGFSEKSSEPPSRTETGRFE